MATAPPVGPTGRKQWQPYQAWMNSHVIAPIIGTAKSNLAAASNDYVSIRQAIADIPNDPRMAGLSGAAATTQYNRIKAYHTRAFRASMQRHLGVEVNFYDTVRMQRAGVRYIKKNVALIRTVQTRVKDDLVRKFRALNDAGKDFDQKAKLDVLNQVHGNARFNAMRIARDQTSKLIGQFNEIRQQEVGIEKYEWSSSGDQRVRDTHQSYDGNVYAWKKPPPEGHPGEPILCRCVALAIIPSVRKQKAAQTKAKASAARVKQAKTATAAATATGYRTATRADIGKLFSKNVSDAEERQWHVDSFEGANYEFVKAIASKYPGLKQVKYDVRESPHFDANFDEKIGTINMSNLKNDKRRLQSQGTWRHEFGHALDQYLLAPKDIGNRFRIRTEIERTGQKQWQAAYKADRKTFLDAHNAEDATRLIVDQTTESVEWALAFTSQQARTKALRQLASDAKIDYDDMIEYISKQGFLSIEAASEMTQEMKDVVLHTIIKSWQKHHGVVFIRALQGESLAIWASRTNMIRTQHNFYSAEFKAMNKFILDMPENYQKGKSYLFSTAVYKKGTTGKLSDAFHAMSNESYGGAGWHSPSYYNKTRSYRDGRASETYANLVCMMSGSRFERAMGRKWLNKQFNQFNEDWGIKDDG